jgi:LPS sulfotransferase NodH
MSKRIYDLATEVADYPVRQGKPDRTLLLCSHPRSGSTLLGESLYASGVFGCPIEYFHRGFRPAFVKRWQATDALSLRNAAHRYRTDSSGLFSTKLFWQDIEDIATELEPSLAGKLRGSVPANVYHHVFNLLEEWFPNPTFIYLTRKDICRQAISEVIANQTQQWRLIHGQGAQTEMP